MGKLNDFDKYSLKLNVASARLFEQLTGKSFFQIGEEDTMALIYCCLCTNNDFCYTYDVFLGCCENEKIAGWLVREFAKQTAFNEQLKYVHNEEAQQAEEETEEKDKPFTISEYASALIVNYGVDPHYVNYEMPLYEIKDYFWAGEMKRRSELEQQRLFTYLTILPHMDPKKHHKVEDILPFPWEKEAKLENAKDDLKKKAEMIKRTFEKMNGGQNNG